MPRTAKKEKKDDSIKEKKIKNSTSKRISTTKKVTSKKSPATKKVTTKKSSTTKKVATKKSSTVAKKVTPKTTRKSSTKSKATNTVTSGNVSPVLEYYDLPYRYNQTLVRILAQTPSTLFVYWDISDIDRTNFTQKYGNDFFNKTRPILLVHNKTKNYYFEVPINDFANSWYLRMQEPDCEYDIELGRRDIENPSQYVYVSSSNELASPNDHVLFDETDFTNIRFKNVKTGSISQKDFGSIRLMAGIGNIYNKKHKVYRFYNDLYKDEVLENSKMFSNPSSNSAFKTF